MGDENTLDENTLDSIPAPCGFHKEFMKSGDGPCRTNDGGHGRYQRKRRVRTLEACKTLCEGNHQCRAIEYNRRGKNCELHFDSVRGKKSGKAKCYRMYYQC